HDQGRDTDDGLPGQRRIDRADQLVGPAGPRRAPPRGVRGGRPPPRPGGGGRLFTFGNGGSCTDATTLARLFARPPVGRPEKSLPAWPLTADPAILTALGNDVGFELVFARQLIARARAGDVAIAMSTSGNSPNLLTALAEARARGLYTVGFAGYDGGAFVDNADVDCCFVVRSQSVHRIQEAQALLGYALWSATHERFGDREVGAV
ncbi:SIS domain-containing protein, partial [Mycobacterium helveticum]